MLLRRKNPVTAGWEAPVTILPLVPGGGLVITKMFYSYESGIDQGLFRLIENGTKRRWQQGLGDGTTDTYPSDVDFGDGLKFGPGSGVSIQVLPRLTGPPNSTGGFCHITVVGYII